jgi:hypothetical protein
VHGARGAGKCDFFAFGGMLEPAVAVAAWQACDPATKRADMPSARPPTPRQARHPNDAAPVCAPVPWALRPWHWLRAVLKRPLRLERRGVTVHIVLAPSAAAATSTATPEPDAGGALRRSHAELRALMRRHRDTRHLMRHLGYLEEALGRSGSRALRREVPVPVLRKALAQLDLLVRDEPSDALSTLRQRIDAAIGERSRFDSHDPVASSEVQVSEASHSLFDEMERSWTGQVPLADAPQAPPAR